MRAPVRAAIMLSVLSSACGPPVDLSKALQVLDVSTGWVDAGILNGQNKLVPSISIKLKNVSNQSLGSLQVNALFRRIAQTDEWDSRLTMVAGSEGLGPGATTKTLVITSPTGYTGTEPRLDILKNSQFVDAKVELFGKYGSGQWTRLGEDPIARQL